ncbi:hypothetical protein ACJX0J_012605 [Zea mays]
MEILVIHVHHNAYLHIYYLLFPIFQRKDNFYADIVGFEIKNKVPHMINSIHVIQSFIYNLSLAAAIDETIVTIIYMSLHIACIIISPQNYLPNRDEIMLYDDLVYRLINVDCTLFLPNSFIPLSILPRENWKLFTTAISLHLLEQQSNPTIHGRIGLVLLLQC